MKEEINILYLEDNPADALLFDKTLSQSGLKIHSRRVESREDFLQALSQPLDVILSDHGLPSFDGLTALGVAHEKCPEVPFIFVTNALTEDMEIERLTGIVTDFVPKSRLDKLPMAVCTALEEAEAKRVRKEVSELLAKSWLWKGYLPICSSCKKIRDKDEQWKLPEVFFRDQLKLQFTHGLCPDCLPKFFPNK